MMSPDIVNFIFNFAGAFFVFHLMQKIPDQTGDIFSLQWQFFSSLFWCIWCFWSMIVYSEENFVFSWLGAFLFLEVNFQALVETLWQWWALIMTYNIEDVLDDAV